MSSRSSLQSFLIRFFKSSIFLEINDLVIWKNIMDKLRQGQRDKLAEISGKS